MKKVSLTAICEEIIFKNEIMSVRTLQRRFEKLISCCGGNLDALKNKNNHIFFDESDKLFVKTILEQLYLNEGIAAQFIDKNKTDEYVGLDKVREFVQQYLKNLANHGASEAEIQENLNFLAMLFLLPVKENYEKCHVYLDYIFLNLEQYPYTHQAIMTDKIANEMKKMFVCTIAEATVEMEHLLQFIKMGQELSDEPNSLNWYGDDEVAVEYKERDRRVYHMLKKDDKLRGYMEDKLKVNIDEIFPEIEKEYE